MSRALLSFGGIRIEKTCDNCGGTGDDNQPRLLHFITGPWCDVCHGLGVVPNDDGLALIEFITDHITSKEGGLRPIKK